MKNGCGGWGGTWAKRQSHRVYRSHVHHSLWHIHAEEDYLLPRFAEVINDDMLKKQGKEWIGDQRGWGRFLQQTGRLERAMRK